MLIAHVTFSVSAENRTFALEALIRESATVCAMHGCVAFVPFRHPGNEQDIGVLHEWDSAQDFEAYLASKGFAEIGAVLRPLMVAAPVSKRFDATPIAA